MARPRVAGAESQGRGDRIGSLYPMRGVMGSAVGATWGCGTVPGGRTPAPVRHIGRRRPQRWAARGATLGDPYRAGDAGSVALRALLRGGHDIGAARARHGPAPFGNR